MFFDGSDNQAVAGQPVAGAVGYFVAYNSPALDFGNNKDFSIDFYIYDMGCGFPVRTPGARTPCYNTWMGTSDSTKVGRSSLTTIKPRLVWTFINLPVPLPFVWHRFPFLSTRGPMSPSLSLGQAPWKLTSTEYL